jgi:meiotically up-regulated gene 157 (Mug157) protein
MCLLLAPILASALHEDTTFMRHRRGEGVTSCPSTTASTCPDARPPPSGRNFVSPAVDAAIEKVAAEISDPDIACIFRNTLPNTLDTTVSFDDGPVPLSFVITGDIDAMWLRDSTNQVLPYLPFAKQDAKLQRMLAGVVRRQTEQVSRDPWANAHTHHLDDESPHTDDGTSKPTFAGTRTDAMVPGVFERKYELDSLCAFLKLSRSYWEQTADAAPFDAAWVRAVTTVAAVVKGMQRSTEAQVALPGGATYQFARLTTVPTDTLLLQMGPPARVTGMSRSTFRPSDDACSLPFLVPANAMAVVELRSVAAMLPALPANATTGGLAAELTALAGEIDAGIAAHAVHRHATGGGRGAVRAYAYEVDGYGNALWMCAPPRPLTTHPPAHVIDTRVRACAGTTPTYRACSRCRTSASPTAPTPSTRPRERWSSRTRPTRGSSPARRARAWAGRTWATTRSGRWRSSCAR